MSSQDLPAFKLMTLILRLILAYSPNQADQLLMILRSAVCVEKGQGDSRESDSTFHGEILEHSHRVQQKKGTYWGFQTRADLLCPSSDWLNGILERSSLTVLCAEPGRSVLAITPSSAGALSIGVSTPSGSSGRVFSDPCKSPLALRLPLLMPSTTLLWKSTSEVSAAIVVVQEPPPASFQSLSFRDRAFSSSSGLYLFLLCRSQHLCLIASMHELAYSPFQSWSSRKRASVMT